MEPIDIVIHNFRRLHYLGALINAIEERTTFPYRIIVVDNYSTPKTKEYIEHLKQDGHIWKSVYNEKNLLLSVSFKRGIDLVESEYCVITIDDCLPPFSDPCWLTQLNYLIRNNEDYGAIAIVIKKENFNDYFKKQIEKINLPLDKNNVQEKRALEEFFQIQKTDDLKKVWLFNTQRERRQYRLREFAKRMKLLFNKKVGIVNRLLSFRAVTWNDENNGYDKDLLEKGKFEIICGY